MLLRVSVAWFIVVVRVATARQFFDLVPRAARNFWRKQLGSEEQGKEVKGGGE